MTRKYWIILGIGLLLACLVVAIVAGLWLTRNIPAVARLVQGEPPSPTPAPTLRATFTPMVVIATLTQEAPPTPTEIPPSPSPGPTATPLPAATETQPSATPEESEPSPTPEPPSPTPTPEPPTSTPKPPRPQKIAFETQRGNSKDYEIFVMNTDGSQQTNVSNNWADDVAPVWSPDGRHIAFISFRDTLMGKWGLGNGALYVMDYDLATGQGGGNARRLTDDGGSEGWPTWSPDGKWIAFQSDRGGNWDIWAIKLDGTGLTQLTTFSRADRYAAWSPNGKKLAFTSKRSGSEDIWVIDVQNVLQGTGNPNPVNLTQSPSRDRYPMWSPDGKKLTFNTDRDGNFEIYTMNADGSNPRNVSNSPSTEGLADWSPDGKSLVFYSDRPGNKDVFRMPLATGQWTNLTKNPASDEFCTWSP